MKDLISIIHTILVNINYIITAIMVFMSLYFLCSQNTHIKIWQIAIIILSQINLLLILYRRNKLAEAQEKRTIFTYYAYNVFLELAKSDYTLSDNNLKPYIFNCLSCIESARKPWYSKKNFIHPIEYPSFDSPDYLIKYTWYIERHSYTSFRDYYTKNSQKNVQLAVYLFLFDVLLLSYHKVNVNEPIKENDSPFFDSLAKKIGYTIGCTDDDLIEYKKTFCSFETRNKLAKKLTYRLIHLD